MRYNATIRRLQWIVGLLLYHKLTYDDALSRSPATEMGGFCIRICIAASLEAFHDGWWIILSLISDAGEPELSQKWGGSEVGYLG